MYPGWKPHISPARRHVLGFISVNLGTGSIQQTDLWSTWYISTRELLLDPCQTDSPLGWFVSLRLIKGPIWQSYWLESHVFDGFILQQDRLRDINTFRVGVPNYFLTYMSVWTLTFMFQFPFVFYQQIWTAHYNRKMCNLCTCFFKLIVTILYEQIIQCNRKGINFLNNIIEKQSFETVI